MKIALRSRGVETFTVVVLALSIGACTAEKSPPGGAGGGTGGSPPAAAKDGDDGADTDHGAAVDLGTVEVAGKQFRIVRMGEVQPGVEAAFEVEGVAIPRAELEKLNLYLWVEDAAGTQLSAPAKGTMEESRLHFHCLPRAGSAPAARVVLRLRSGETDERGSLPLDGHGHEHGGGPHHGIVAPFAGGAGTSGFIELKLHDDKGDLELWLAADPAITRPFDLPLSAEIEVQFVDVGGRSVELRPRDGERNEDEAGTPNIRDGRTNYFIFPSRAGEDASWLVGAGFSSVVIVRFTAGGAACVSEEFVLVPHTH